MTGDESGDERMVSEIVPIAVPIEVETDTVTLALPAVVAVGLLASCLAICRLRNLARSRIGAEPSPGTNVAMSA